MQIVLSFKQGELVGINDQVFENKVELFAAGFGATLWHWQRYFHVGDTIGIKGQSWL
jgi:hypothetical protein